MLTYTGLDSTQFQEVLNAVAPMMHPSFKNFESLERALYIYLLKLITNYTLEQIAPHFNKSSKIVSIWIRKIRELAYRALVPKYVSNISRDELLRNTTSSVEKFMK